VLLLLLVALAPGARADDRSDEARYELFAYIWGTSMALHVDTDEGEVSDHVPFSDLFKHLSGGFMARARGDWGPWSATLDGFYTKLRGEKVSKNVRLGPRGGIQIGAEVESHLDQWIVEATGGHRLFQLGSPFSNRASDKRHFSGEIYAGARYWSVDPKIEVEINTTKFRIGDRTQWVDPVIGLRFAADLSSTVVFVVSGDVGGFNIGGYCSDFTWSQMTALNWAFGENWSTQAGYKFLDFRRDSSGAEEHIQLRGPFIALSYRF
jgi:hypothetical protein